MSVQIPKSIRKVSSSIAAETRARKGQAICLEDFPIELQDKWERTCDHEMFYQDANRFIGDIVTEINFGR